MFHPCDITFDVIVNFKKDFFLSELNEALIIKRRSPLRCFTQKKKKGGCEHLDRNCLEKSALRQLMPDVRLGSELQAVHRCWPAFIGGPRESRCQEPRIMGA